MSCVPNVASFSGLFFFALCLVYPMLTVSLDCLSSLIRWRQSRETGNIGYTRHKVKTTNPEKLATWGTQDIRRRQTMLPISLDCLSSPYILCTQCCRFLWIVSLRLMSCVPNVASFSGLFVFDLCLQSRETGNIGYTRYKAKTKNPEKLVTLGTQDIRRRQTIQRNWQLWVHKT
jgi:ribosomal protein L33